MSYIFANRTAIDHHFVCKLCNVPWDPNAALQCPQCEDVYCRACVEEATLKHLPCLNPACTLPFDILRCVPVHRTVRSLADSQVEVMCRYNLRKCPWTGTRSAVHAHEQSCTFATPTKPLFVNAVPEELICQICSEVLTDPLQVPTCQHLFCGVCLTMALSNRQACPTCASPATSTEAVPKIITSQLDNLQVFCANRDIGCTYSGARRNYAGHIASCTATNQGTAKATPAAANPHQEAKFEIKNEFPFLQANVPSTQTLASLLHIEAPELVNLDDRKQPLCISAAIDVSGSMSGEKIALVRESLEFMVEELTERDSFGIVTFESSCREVMPILRMTKEVKARAITLIKQLRDLGSTDLHGGLVLSIRQVSEFCTTLLTGATKPGSTTPPPVPLLVPAKESSKKSKKPGFFSSLFSSDSQPTSAPPPVAQPATATSNVVLLFTDGQANAGISDATAIVQSVKGMLQSAPSLSIYTFGFGADHNASLLQAIAEASQGSYYFIKNTEVLKESFADCLGGLVSTVMSDIRVSMTLNSNAVTIKKLLTKYPCTTDANGTITVTIKDMYSTESRDIPLELLVQTAGFQPQSAMEYIVCKLTYVSAFDQQVHSRAVSGTIELKDTKYEGQADIAVDEQRNRFLVAEALQEAKKAAEQHNFDDAQQRMADVRRMVKASSSSASPQTQLVVQDAIACQAMLTPQMYHSGGSQGVNAAMSRQYQQRCNDVADDAMYANAWKCSKKAKARQ